MCGNILNLIKRNKELYQLLRGLFTPLFFLSANIFFKVTSFFFEHFHDLQCGNPLQNCEGCLLFTGIVVLVQAIALLRLYSTEVSLLVASTFKKKERARVNFGPSTMNFVPIQRSFLITHVCQLKGNDHVTLHYKLSYLMWLNKLTKTVKYP